MENKCVHALFPGPLCQAVDLVNSKTVNCELKGQWGQVMACFKFNGIPVTVECGNL